MAAGGNNKIETETKRKGLLCILELKKRRYIRQKGHRRQIDCARGEGEGRLDTLDQRGT